MTIKLRKGRGKPVERRVFYLTDESGKIQFEFWTPGLAFTEKPKTRAKNAGRWKTILSVKNLRLFQDLETGRFGITIFHGLHPSTKMFDEWEWIRFLTRLYIYIYRVKSGKIPTKFPLEEVKKDEQ